MLHRLYTQIYRLYTQIIYTERDKTADQENNLNYKPKKVRQTCTKYETCHV